MKQIIAIGGVPGTGKTELMKKVIGFADDWVCKKPADLLDAIYSESLDTFILGKYQPYYAGEGYAQGTDRLSMAVQPKATEWIGTTDSHVIFEGDRLFARSFLEHCNDLTDKEFHIFLLNVSKDILQERYASRGSEQSEKFIRGRETKYNNLSTNFDLIDVIKECQNETPEQREEILSSVAYLLGVVK